MGIESDLVLYRELDLTLLSVEDHLYLVFGSEFTWLLCLGIQTDLVLEWGSKPTCVQRVVGIMIFSLYRVENDVVLVQAT